MESIKLSNEELNLLSLIVLSQMEQMGKIHCVTESFRKVKQEELVRLNNLNSKICEMMED